MDFVGKVVLVTGASRGIGRAIAGAFAQEGAAVALSYVSNPGAADHVVDALRRGGRRAMAIKANAAKATDVDALLSQVQNEWGRLDVLVNNAGIMRRTPLAEVTMREWEEVVATNLTGAFLCSQRAAPELARQQGAIVNVASIRGLVGGTATAYAASKGGLIALTKALARLLAPEVRVNAVAPGLVDTAMTSDFTVAQREELTAQIPVGRFAEPEDVARAVLFLASPRASYVTGQTLVIDGGLTMW
jgi:3-oxoacyl-[acyl-carrier protein] reductase